MGKLPASGRLEEGERCPSLQAADGVELESSEAPSTLRVKAVADWWINVLCLQGTNALFFLLLLFSLFPSPYSLLPHSGLADDSCWSLNKMSS